MSIADQINTPQEIMNNIDNYGYSTTFKLNSGEALVPHTKMNFDALSKDLMEEWDVIEGVGKFRQWDSFNVYACALYHSKGSSLQTLLDMCEHVGAKFIFTRNGKVYLEDMEPVQYEIEYTVLGDK